MRRSTRPSDSGGIGSKCTSARRPASPKRGRRTKTQRDANARSVPPCVNGLSTLLASRRRGIGARERNWMSVRKLAAAPIGVMVAVALLLAAAQAEAKWKAPAPRYYLALGDSLSQGVQPNVNGLSLETNQGYADQLYANVRGRI